MNNRSSVFLIWITLLECFLGENVNRISFLDDLLIHPEWAKNHKGLTETSLGYVRKITPHPQSKSIFVATNDSVIRLSMDTLEKMDEVKWTEPRNGARKCDSKRECADTGRIVTLMVPIDESFGSSYAGISRAGVFACWSDGASSECSLRMAANLRGPPRELWKGTDRCPRGRSAFSVAIFTSNRNLYFTSTGGVSSNKQIEIVRVTLNKNEQSAVRTTPRTQWITQDASTVFVHSYEFHNAIYYVFRELSEEVDKQCGEQVIVSRVGRICLNDDGGVDKRLSSFSKATLVCTDSHSKVSPLHTHVQSVWIDAASKTLFAAFTTSSSIPASSAICIYKLTDIEDAFKGPFLKPDGGKTTFRTSGKCEKADIRSWFDHHLMYNVIRPKSTEPVIEVQGERWSHLVVDWMPFTPKSDYNLILFTVDSRGRLRKWHHFKAVTCLIEEIRRNQYLGHSQIITDLALLDGGRIKDKSLLMSTGSGIFRIAVARCGKLGHTKQGCIVLHDPYCFWDETTSKCVLLEDERAKGDRFDSCPLREDQIMKDFRIDGAWGAWSPWSSCDLNKNAAASTANEMDVKPKGCRCRYRFCSSPSAFGDGAKICTEGSTLEMVNCSVDGGWSTWSAWSGCEPACLKFEAMAGIDQSKAIRTRRRWCTNPSPMGPHGTVCKGHSTEEEACPEPTVACPADQLPQPSWSQWSEWSACSVKCNGGYQIRRRECGRYESGWRPSPPDEELARKPPTESYTNDPLCVGESVEERGCNQDPCPLTRVSSSWTEWYLVSGDNAIGTHERRYRVECEAQVPESDNLQVGQEKQLGACRVHTSGGLICNEVDSPTGDKDQTEGSWSAWTECSRPCGGGFRHRWRKGDAETSKSDDREEEVCNIHAFEARWGCWSAWSECSAAPCSPRLGEQRRHRQCLVINGTVKNSPTDPEECDGGQNFGLESRPCQSDRQTIHCTENGQKSIKIGEESEVSVMDDAYDSLEPTTWAAWSECFPLNQEKSPVQVRARTDCPGCDTLEARRCDTFERIPISEVFEDGEFSTSGRQKKYTTTHAAIVAIVAALLGVALVLIPYMGYMMKKRIKEEKKQKSKRSSLWKRLIDGNTNPDQNSPYIIAAETKNHQKPFKSHEPNATLRTQDTWLNQGTGTLRRSNLTRIQMLHGSNEKRNGNTWNGRVAGDEVQTLASGSPMPTHEIYGPPTQWNNTHPGRSAGTIRQQ